MKTKVIDFPGAIMEKNLCIKAGATFNAPDMVRCEAVYLERGATFNAPKLIRCLNVNILGRNVTVNVPALLSTWPGVETLTDEELMEERKKLPKYLNDMTDADKMASAILSVGGDRRNKTAIDEYNAKVIETTGINHGDLVTVMTTGLFGLSAGEAEGKVCYNREGRLVARFKGYGQRNIHKGMRRI